MLKALSRPTRTFKAPSLVRSARALQSSPRLVASRFLRLPFHPMPELPDIVIYIEALEQRILDQTLERILIGSPFLLRTAVPPITSVEGRRVVQLRRLGKRICIGFENDLWVVLHLMIAGRLHWRAEVSIARVSGRTLPKSRKK